jgi:hypothetical protein
MTQFKTICSYKISLSNIIYNIRSKESIGVRSLRSEIM